MTQRLSTVFASCAAQNRAAFVTFLMAGDPDMATAAALLSACAEAGSDILEIGMPFTDPMADGKAIQAAGVRALKAKTTLRQTLAMVRDFRIKNQTTPLVLMGYYNPIYVYGVETFLAEAKESGVDGLIVVDLPPEEDGELCLPAKSVGLDFIRLATPTTDEKRLPKVLTNTSGFVYYVSIAGITGSASAEADAVSKAVSRIKAFCKLPVAVGFGIKTPEAAVMIARVADGVVVGSALVDILANSLDADGKATPNTVPVVAQAVKDFAKAIHGARLDAVIPSTLEPAL